jgi:putative hydrolases of HD superfamily
MSASEHHRLRTVLLEALRLKEIQRTGWVRAGVQDPESVAAHSWGVAWLVLVLCPRQIDLERALALAVLHDLAEVRVGDLTPHCGVSPERKSLAERRALQGLLQGLPRAGQLHGLWEEYEARGSIEARFVRACDKLDMALQAARYAEQGPDLQEFVDSALVELGDPLMRALAGEP